MTDVDLSAYRNPEFNPGSKVKRLLWYVCSLIFFQSYLFPSYALKRSLLRLFGSKIGRGVVVKPNVQIKFPWYLSVGEYAWIGEKVWIDNLVPVSIGSHSCISQGAMLLTGNHNYKSKHFELIMGEIHLERGVWIGARAMVCPGVRGGEHAVLSVMSVAVNDLEPRTVYAGSPAAAVRKREIQ